MKVYIGDIVSVNSSEEVFRYLVEDAGRICYVGDVLPEKYASAERVDVDSRALLPAFVDIHQHFASFSTFNAGLNVMDAALTSRSQNNSGHLRKNPRQNP